MQVGKRSVHPVMGFYLTDEECKFRCVIRLDALLNRFYLTDEECKSGKGDVRILHEHVFI